MASDFTTARLRLVPIGPDRANDLLELHRDTAIAQWYVDEAQWTPDDGHRAAAFMAKAWDVCGVAKWLAYDRSTGELVGRGGLARLELDSSAAQQIITLLPDEPWVTEGIEVAPRVVVARHWLEVGWALRGKFHGQGYATEIGTASLDHAFGPLRAEVVVAFSERHNRPSFRVMERLGMQHAGDIVADGLIEGIDGVQPNAVFGVYLIARKQRRAPRA